MSVRAAEEVERGREREEWGLVLCGAVEGGGKAITEGARCS